MERKAMQYIPIRGMSKDLSISKFSNEFSFDNYNIRINSSKDEELFTITNETGNKRVMYKNTDLNIEGTVINTTVIDKYVVLFTTTRETTTPLGNENAPTGSDYIYRLEFDNTSTDGNIRINPNQIFNGYSGELQHESLNFAKDALIETIGVLESEEVIKVYFIDKNNQPRFINIVDGKIGSFTNKSFDFAPSLNLNETVSVTKQFTGGSFHSGVIQYAMSYWNKNGTETNLFYITNLFDISYNNRAGSPEETCNCSFKITINNIERSFDYLRIYSIERTSLDAAPTGRIVKDIYLSQSPGNSISIVDNGETGANYDTNLLPFIGGEEVILGTITTKDNVLFGGNIRLKRPSLEDVNIQAGITRFTWDNSSRASIQQYDPTTKAVQGESYFQEASVNANAVYNYRPYTLLNSSNYLRHWKKGETYRVGIQAQYKTGIWSEVGYVGDYTVDKGYFTRVESSYAGSPYFMDETSISYVKGMLILSASLVTDLYNKGYRKVRPVYVPLTNKDRHIIGQGVITNTLASVNGRSLNTPFAYPDYITRGNNELVPYTNDSVILDDLDYPSAMYPLWQHFSPLNTTANFVGPNSNFYQEIEYTDRLTEDIDKLTNTRGDSLYYKNFKNTWYIDSNLNNIWGADIEHGDVRFNLNNVSSIIFRGSANITAASNIFSTLTDQGKTDGVSYSFPNYDYGANRILTEPLLELMVNNTGRSAVFIWGSNQPGTIYDTDRSITQKDYSRVVFCGFNDMFRDEVTPRTMSIYEPLFIDPNTSVYNYNTNQQDGATGNINYMSQVDEVISGTNGANVVPNRIMYESGPHLLFSFRNNYTVPIYAAGYVNTEGNRTRDNFDTPYYRNNPSITNTGFTTPTINNIDYLGIQHVDMKNRLRTTGYGNYQSGYPYLWIVDLYKNVVNQYGGNTYNDINQNTWIPCGEPMSINSSSVTLTLDRGDTYIQRYDVLKTSRGVENYQRVTEVLSVLVESFVNEDGRYDTKRGNLKVNPYTQDNYSHVNPVYSQKNNVFEYNTLDYNLLLSDDLPTSFLWTNTKIYGETIDSWTSLNLGRSYTVDGVPGPINYLDNYNNDLLGFQDKGIFNIIFNPRVQIATSDDVPIEITNSGEVQGVRYINNKIGTTNKWTVKQSNKALYFIDTLNKDLYRLTDGFQNISEEMYFKSWFSENITTTKEYSYTNNDAFILNVDSENDDIYITNKDYCLGLSERLNLMESFFSYENKPFMFNAWGKHFAISTVFTTGTGFWAQKEGEKNNFFGEVKPSSIEYYMCPESAEDKIFDVIQYRADLFDTQGNYLPLETFNTLEVSNEFQESSKPLMQLGRPMYHTMKKFRTWNTPLPRQRGTMNRIRNPWLKLKLTLENEKAMSLKFHDLILGYTI